VVIGAPNYSQTITFNDDFENAKAPKHAVDALLTVSSVLPDTNNITGSNDIELTTGRAYVLLGDSNGVSSNSTQFTLDGSPIFNSDAEAGYSVSGAGDINSDGFEDLVIGAPAEGKGAGMTYVVAGRESFSDDTLQLAWESNLLITGPAAHSQSGTIVSDAGDFNADKADDIVIGSPNAGFSAGQAHVLFGNTSESKNPLWSDDYSTAFSLAPGTSQSIAFFNQSGSTPPDPNIGTFVLNGTNPKDAMIPTRGAADVNGDGVDDLLASATIGNQIGILFGHPWLADEGSLKIKDLKSDQGFIVDQQPSGAGKVVQLLGDLNQDGYAETLVAGSANQSTIVFGASTQELLDGGLATRELTLTHNGAAKFAAVGDVNGDGFQDVVAALTDPAELVLLLGSAELATQGTQALAELKPKISLSGPVDTIFSALDFNNDGLNDWITKGANAASLYLGRADGTIAAPLRFTPPVESAVNDVNQDGVSDLVGINSNNEPAITLGVTQNGSIPGRLTLGVLPRVASAYQVVNAGDVNGDGTGDFALSLAGQGTVTLAVSQGRSATPSYTYLQFIDGTTDTLQVSTGGDINGDGLDDLVIGQPTAGSNAGELFLVFGNSKFQEIASNTTIPLADLKPAASTSKPVDGVTVLGLNIAGLATSQAGTSVSGGEDVNGDGLADFATGAPAVDNLSYVLFGGDFTAALTQVGTLANDVLKGTATGDAMIGNSGTDFLLGNGGIDALAGGSGNDVFTIADTNFRRIDGGSGFDVLKLEGDLDQSWNLVDLALGKHLQNLEVIDTTGYGNNRLSLTPTTVLNLSSTSNTVFIDADNQADLEIDTLLLSDDFTSQGTVSANGLAYEKYTAGEATVFVTPGADVVSSLSLSKVTVANAEDVVDGDTSNVIALQLNPGKDGISLREAVLATNNTIGADQIDFASNLADKKITLTQGELAIKDDLTISGLVKSPGGPPSITISGNGKSRVFNVDDSDDQSSKMVSLENLNIIDGFTPGSGGGISNREDLTIVDSIISGNTSEKDGGGIYNYNYLLTVKNSSVSNNKAAAFGGGVASYQNVVNPQRNAKLSITESTISGNSSSSSSAGGIYIGAYSQLELYKSTVNNNSAVGIQIGNLGTDPTPNTVANIRNSTISGNQGPGIVVLNGASLKLYDTTIADNSGFSSLSFLFAGSSSMANTIVSGPGDKLVEVQRAFGQPFPLSVFGINIVSDESLKDPHVLNVDPKLGPLADNGGPTQTHLPQAGSPAIDAVPFGTPVDQRGVKRPQGTNYDIGAVEVQATSLISADATSEKSVDVFDPTPRIFVSETVVSEADGEAQFTVVRTGDVTQGLTLNYTTHDGTANAGVHFTPRQGKVIFAPGEQTTTVTIPLTKDEILRQAIRTFELRITEDFELDSKFRPVIVPGNGDDVVQGGDRANRIFGQAGDDALDGGGGNDVLTGGRGTNTLTGGLGNDTFRVRAGEVVTITDFGGMGRGAKPTAETLAAIDTVQFIAKDLTVETMQLTQVGDDLQVTFLGDETGTLVTLQNFALENFDNLLKTTGANVNFDNGTFADNALKDSLDVFNADSTSGDCGIAIMSPS
jgi:hypothetical protein